MKSVYQVSKDYDQRLWSYNVFWGKEAVQYLQVRVSLIFINSFLILLYFSYEIHVPSFEMLCPMVVKLEEILKKTGCTIPAGMSFHSYFLILF